MEIAGLNHNSTYKLNLVSEDVGLDNDEGMMLLLCFRLMYILSTTSSGQVAQNTERLQSLSIFNRVTVRRILFIPAELIFCIDEYSWPFQLMKEPS